MRKILTLIIGLVVGVSGFAQKMPNVSMNNLHIDNKITFKMRTPYPENHMSGWLQEVGDLFLSGTDSCFYYFNGQTYVRLISTEDLDGLSLVESDPVYAASVAYGIDAGDIADWNSAVVHVGNTSNPHSVTKAQVGLSNVDNESKATMFTNAVFTGGMKSDTVYLDDNNYLVSSGTQSITLKSRSPGTATIILSLNNSGGGILMNHDAGVITHTQGLILRYLDNDIYWDGEIFRTALDTIIYKQQVDSLIALALADLSAVETDPIYAASVASLLNAADTNRYGLAYSHSLLTNNPHSTTASQVGAVALADSTAGVGHYASNYDMTTGLAGKQATLVSGTNIKTINSTSILGSGDIAIAGSDPDSSIFATQTDVDSISNTLIQAYDIGGDHYVAPWGSDAAAGTFDAPWKTWKHAGDSAVAGDTIYFRGGVYDINGNDDGIYITNHDGTSTNPICLWAYPGETPILDCFGITYSTGSNYGVYIRDCAYWSVKGLHVRGQQGTAVYYGYGFYLRGNTHCTFENLVAYDCEGPGINIGWPGSDDNYLINCDAYDNFDVAQNGENANGIEVNGTDPATTHYVINCRAWNNSDDGLESFDSDGLIYFTNCWSFNNGRGSAGDGDGLKLGTAANTDENVRRVVKNCLIVNNRQNGVSRNSANVTIEMYNNIIYGSLDEGIWMSQYAHADIAKYNIAYNNGGDYEQSFASSTIHDHNDWDTDVTISDADFVSLDSMQLYRPRKSNGDLPDITFLRIKEGSDVLSYGVIGPESNKVQSEVMEGKIRETIDGSIILSDWGIVGDGTTDDAAAINAMLTAKGAGAKIKFPKKVYRINSTITLLDQQKVDFNFSNVIVNITNGTAAIHVPKTFNTWRVDNVFMYGYGNAYKNYIGLQIGDGFANGSSDAAYYGEFSNVVVYWARIGFEVNGYTLQINRIRSRYCGIGFTSYGMNNTGVYDAQFELDSVEFNIIGGGDILFTNLLLQGNIDIRPSRIDGSLNLTIETLYNENNNADQDSALIIIGGKEHCTNIAIRNASLYTDVGPNPYIEIDDVSGIELSGIWPTTTYSPPFTTTSLTTGLNVKNFTQVVGNKVVDNHHVLGPRYNYFPNSSFEGGIKGWSNISHSGVDVIAEEHDTVRSGDTSLKICAGYNYSQVLIYLDNDVAKLQGKKVTLGAWLFLPDCYQDGATVTRTIFPNIVFSTYDGANTNSTYTSNAKYFQTGYWNFYHDTLTVQDDATSMYLQIYANNTATILGDSVCVIVDDIQLVDGNVSATDMLNTKYPDADDLSATIRNNHLILTADAVPTDDDQTYSDGDQVWKATTVASQSPGWICTTGGVGGTAAWAPMANLGTP